MSNSKSQQNKFPATITRQELMVDGSDAKFRKLLYEFTVVAGRIETMRAAFAKRLGVTRPQFNILLYIAQHQGQKGLTTTQVAKALKVTSAHVVQEVKQLVHLNLLIKKQNPEDGRSVLLNATDHGFEKIIHLAPVLKLVNDELFGSLSKSDFELMSKLTDSILEDAELVLSKLPAYMSIE